LCASRLWLLKPDDATLRDPSRVSLEGHPHVSTELRHRAARQPIGAVKTPSGQPQPVGAAPTAAAMDAAIVPLDAGTVVTPDADAMAAQAELSRVERLVKDGALGGPEHRVWLPPDVKYGAPDDDTVDTSTRICSKRTVDRKADPLYALDLLHDIRNELAPPRPDEWDERRVLQKLRSLKTFARGSCGDVPGATAKDVRDVLVLGKAQTHAIAALSELLKRTYGAATRYACVELIQALSLPDVASGDGLRWDSIIGDEWSVSSNTERQKVLSFSPGLVEGLVSWLQSSCVRHETAANEREELPNSLSPTKKRGYSGEQPWEQHEVKVCALVLMTLRNLSVSSETASRLGRCQAIPPLLTCLRFGPLELTQPAVACLVPIALWHPRLIGLHGGVAPLVGMLRVPKLPLARAAAIRILGEVAPDEDDCGEIVDHGGCDLLAAIAFDGVGGRRRKAGLPSTVAHAQIGSLWTLARIATHPQHIDALRDDRIRKAVLRALEASANPIATEAALMLLRKLGHVTPHGEGDPWAQKLALDAAPLAAACASYHRPEPVRAQAATNFEQLYVTDGSRHKLVFGRDLRDVEMTSETDLGPTDYLDIVYGRESAEAVAGRARKKAAELGRRLDDVVDDATVDEAAEKLVEEKRRLRTAPPPSTRVRIFDDPECIALRDAPVPKRGASRLLDDHGSKRLLRFDGGRIFWETRAKVTGFLQTCIAHNAYEEEFAALHSDPKRVEQLRWDAKVNKGIFSRYKDPCLRKDLGDGLPAGVVDIPETYDGIECEDIVECRRVGAEEIERLGVPEMCNVEPAGFFLVRTASQTMLVECVPDRPQFGPPPHTKEEKEALAFDVAGDWILRLLGLLEDHCEALGQAFDLEGFDKAAHELREERRKDTGKRRGSLDSVKKDPNEMNPRWWEALVERACGGASDDMLHEMALAEQHGHAKPSLFRNAPTKRRKHPDVIRELWAMVLHPSSVSLVQRGCLAMLSLCSEPGINAHVREHWKNEIHVLPGTFSRGVASKSKVLITKKLELLVLLNQLELVEKELFRLSRPLRTKFTSIILNWRKHLGYDALSSATAGFDKDTLLKLQELFAELDADGSGYLDAEELGVLFKNMSLPMSLSQLKDIVDEIDVDGNGEIDFEEFLLVIKNMQNPSAVQSKLGGALKKGVQQGVLKTSLGAASALFAAAPAVEIPGQRRQNLRHAVDDNRREKLREEIKQIDKDVAAYQKVDPKRKMRRAHLNASWAAACRACYEDACDWGDGVAASEPLLQTLVANPEYIEKLGFAVRPSGWAADNELRKKYEMTVNIASSYPTLARAALNAGLVPDPDDEGTIGSMDGFEDQDWNYREFEEAVVRLVRACRGQVASEQAERERRASQAERVVKVKPKKKGFSLFAEPGKYETDGTGTNRYVL